jgi:hypothetical protein
MEMAKHSCPKDGAFGNKHEINSVTAWGSLFYNLLSWNYNFW